MAPAEAVRKRHRRSGAGIWRTGTGFVRAARAVLAAGAGAAIALTSPVVGAQGYPAKSVRLITPYPPGSGTDTLLRALAQSLNREWAQPVVVDNRPGASTIIAGEACAKSAPDGYTLCMLDRGTLATVPHLYRRLPYDAERDFQPIAHLAYLVSALAVSPQVPATSVAALIDHARQNPGRLNYSSLGDGTPPHLVIEWIKKRYGVDLVHVPFKSPPEIVQTLANGEVQVTYFGLINLLGPIRGGKARALAVSGAQRSPLLPAVPTLGEAGLADLDDRVWFGLFAPAGTPRPIVDEVYRQVDRILADPEFRQRRLIDQGWEPAGTGPEAMAELLRTDSAVAAELVKTSGARVQ